MRSKVQYVDRGERCTKYFFGLEKNYEKKKMINKFVYENTGEALLTQEKITDFLPESLLYSGLLPPGHLLIVYT